MKKQEIHNALHSVYLYLDNLLLDKGEAFKTVEDESLVKTTDDRHPDFEIWSSKYTQWVYDEDIVGATIPNSVEIDGIETSISDDVRIDFQYGRVFLANSGATSVKASFSYKEANLYLFEDNDEAMLEEAFKIADELYDDNGRQITTPPPHRYVAPMIVLSYAKEEESVYSLGGSKNTDFILRAFILANSPYLAMGLTSLLAHTMNQCFPLIADQDDMPLDFYGGIKDGSFSYEDLVDKYKSNGHNYYIEKVNASPTAPISRNRTKMFSSFVEFDIRRYLTSVAISTS